MNLAVHFTNDEGNIHVLQEPISRILAVPANHHRPFDKQAPIALDVQTPERYMPFQSFKSATTRAASLLPPKSLFRPPPPAKVSIFSTMASKITPFLLRSGARCASRVARPQIRAFSITATRPSDTLQVVSQATSETSSASILCQFAPYRCGAVLWNDPCANSLSFRVKTTQNADLIARSTETHPTTTPTSPSSSTPRMRSSSPRSSSDTPPSTKRPPSCPCWTSASASTASPASAS